MPKAGVDNNVNGIKKVGNCKGNPLEIMTDKVKHGIESRKKMAT